jgi:hypothetical protein
MPMNSIEIIQNYIGEELTSEWAHRLADAPFDHIQILLFEKLYNFYIDWLESEEQRRSEEEVNEIDTFHCIDPYPDPINLAWHQQLDHYKKFLLYFPHFTIPDPLAHIIWPIAQIALVTQQFGSRYSIPNEDEFRSNIKEVFLLLSELAPFVSKGDIFLIPSPFVLDYEVVQRGANQEMQSLTKAYYKRFYKIAADYKTDKGGTESVVGDVKVWGQVCSMLDLTPVAGNGLVYEILKQEYQLKKASVRSHQVSQILMQYDVPGVSKASLSEIIALRKNEDAFHEWNSSFGRILEEAHKKAQNFHDDERQFNVELLQAAEAELRKCKEDLQAEVRGSSALDKILIPGALAIGVGSVVAWATHSPEHGVAASAGAKTALNTASWVATKLKKRYDKSGQKARLLCEFYGYLLESQK